MPRYGTSGQLGIRFCPTVVDPTAPTVAEVTAGTDLSGYVTRDGVKTPASGNTLDASAIGSAFNATAPGTYGGDAGTLTCQRGSKGGTTGDDKAWSSLARGTIGFLVVARTGFGQDATTGLGTPAGTPTTADRVEVYPVTVISRAMSDTADNQTSRFEASLAFTADPAMDAAIVAGS
jgi:hypothetical protein